MAQGSLDEGTRKSSVGSAESTESMLTTPQVDVDSATERSSGIKASPPSVSLASRAVRFSARDFVSISRYCGELNLINHSAPRTESFDTYFNANAIIEVGSSNLTTIEESRKICSGSFIGSSPSIELRVGCSQKTDNAFKKELRSVPKSMSVGGVSAMSCLDLTAFRNGEEGRVICPGGRSRAVVSPSRTSGVGETRGGSKDISGCVVGSGWITTSGSDGRTVEEVAGSELGDCRCKRGGAGRSSSFPSSSSSASLEELELSESSAIASLTESSTSTFARA